jgi:hypothetical protein
LSIVEAKDKLVNVNFSKIVILKGTIRIIFNMVAVHVEVSRHPPICLLETLFSCQRRVWEVFKQI